MSKFSFQGWRSIDPKFVDSRLGRHVGAQIIRKGEKGRET